MVNIFNRKNKEMSLIEDEHLETLKMSLYTKELPVVILDNSWHKIKKLIADKEFLSSEEKLMALLKERGELTNKIKSLLKRKTSLLNKILDISNKLNNSGNSNNPILEQEITKSRNLLLQVNDLLEKCNTDSARVEKEFLECNFTLVEDTVAKSYVIMKDYIENISQLDEEIEEHKKLVSVKSEEKRKLEVKQQELYNYLHKIVGRDNIEKLDKIMGVENDSWNRH